MGRMKGRAAILGAAVLMAVVTACGNGAEPTSLSDEVPTPTPPTEIALTQVFEMVRSSHLQSIEVSGDKLEVTTLSSETFASRKPEGTSIVELLAEVGVDHIASGLEITAKGSAARERGSTSAGQTTVTLTPTATPTSDDTAPPIPHGTPRLNLTYEGAVYYAEALSDGDAANLNEDDLELVGVTTESNRLAPGSGESLDIYRLKNDEDGYVYTLEPDSSVQDEVEDGQTITTITIEASWLRWTAANSN